MRKLRNNETVVDILLVEDSKADIRLTKEVFASIDLRSQIHVVTDGEAALDFIYKRGDYVDAETPDLVLLDLNIPKLDGRSVLKTVKEDVDLRRIPVIVLTTSENDEDVNAAYNFHANAYVVKPISFKAFSELIERIRRFWIDEVAFPEKLI